MTEEQIIKALEKRIKALKDDYKRLQALDAPMDCFEESHIDNIRVLSNALDLINRTRAENENLKDILYDADGVNLVNYWHQQCKIAENGCRNFEEENKKQQAKIERLKTHLEELADEVEDKMTYMCGCKNCIETVKRIIKDDVKPFDMYCDSCNRCKHREAEAVKEFAERFLKKVHDNQYLLSNQINSKDYVMFTVGIEQAVNETKKEMVGEANG